MIEGHRRDLDLEEVCVATDAEPDELGRGLPTGSDETWPSYRDVPFWLERRGVDSIDVSGVAFGDLDRAVADSNGDLSESVIASNVLTMYSRTDERLKENGKLALSDRHDQADRDSREWSGRRLNTLSECEFPDQYVRVTDGWALAICK